MTSNYLLFLLSDRLFGVKLVGAIEILPWRMSKRVPLSYSYLEGLLDYRGIIYPVYDLAKRLGTAQTGVLKNASVQQSETNGKSIILLEENKTPFGIVVDGVAKMISLEDQAAAGQPAPPEKLKGIDARYVKGLVYNEDSEIVMLDFERLFHAG